MSVIELFEIVFYHLPPVPHAGAVAPSVAPAVSSWRGAPAAAPRSGGHGIGAQELHSWADLAGTASTGLTLGEISLLGIRATFLEL